MAVYRNAEIPERARKGIQQWVRLDGEAIILLYDRTTFGSASSGMLFTDRRLIVYNERDQQQVRYSELTKVELEVASTTMCRLHLRGRGTLGNRLVIYTTDPEPLREVAALIMRPKGATLDEASVETSDGSSTAPRSTSCRVVHDSKRLPHCPHCEAPLPTISHRGVGDFFVTRTVYFCPHCMRVLGFSER